MKTWKHFTVVAILAIFGIAFAFIACDDGNNTHTHVGNWIITTFPTETANGVETRICTIDQTHVDTRTLTLATFQTYFYGKWIQDNDSNGYPNKDVNSYLIIKADLIELNRTGLNTTANIRVWSVTENNYLSPDYAVDYPSGYGLESTIATSSNPESVGSEGTFSIFINVDKNKLYFRNGNHPTYVKGNP